MQERSRQEMKRMQEEMKKRQAEFFINAPKQFRDNLDTSLMIPFRRKELMVDTDEISGRSGLA
jgi:hypothetical protein